MGDKIFKVSFKKKRSEKEALELLKGFDKTMVDSKKKFRKFSKKLVNGESTVMVCHLLKKEELMGRSHVIDLNAPIKFNIR